jgi:hypothetical protein
VKRAALLALAALLASCSSETTESCPAGVVATLAFSGELTAGAGLSPGLDPDPAMTDCDAAKLGFPSVENRADLAFRGTLATDGTGASGALCRAGAPILFGTRAGPRWTVEEATDGAVLGACGPTCAARSRVVIAGDLAPDPTPVFTGALVEQLTPAAGNCGGCVLPCAARYQLTGAEEAP